MKAVWTVEGYPFGETNMEDGFYINRPSLAVYCDRCGRGWATIELPGLNRKFHPRALPCKHCPRIFLDDFPGSLWANWDQAFIEAMPDLLVEREYIIHLADYDKEISHERDTLEKAA